MKNSPSGLFFGSLTTGATMKKMPFGIFEMVDPPEIKWNQVIDELRELKYILYSPEVSIDSFLVGS